MAFDLDVSWASYIASNIYENIYEVAFDGIKNVETGNAFNRLTLTAADDQIELLADGQTYDLHTERLTGKISMKWSWVMVIIQ